MLLKLEKTLFYIFLFLIPFQIRIFLRNGGNEWNSMFLYLGDVIFMAVLLLAILRKGIKFEKKDIFLLIFVAVAGISLFATSSLGISAFRLIKLIEFALLYIYISSNFKIRNPKPETRNDFFNRILSVIFYSGVLQAILAVAQFVGQGSIGIKFIEAGIFSPNSPGVANFILDGEKIMRSYGSFLHPNVLAGFILLTIFCVYKLLIGNPKSEALNPKQIQTSKLKIQNLLFIVGYLLLVFGLFLTFSRTAIAVFEAISLLFFLVEFFKLRKIEHAEQRLVDGKKLIKLFLLFVIACILSVAILFPYIKARFFTISLEEQAVDLRFFYNKMAIQMIKEKPVLGTGIGNFVNYSQNYPAYLRAASKMLGISGEIPQWIYQPVHNIYLLIASEIGVLGLVVFLGFVVITLLDWFKACFLPARHSLRHQALAGGFLVF